MINVWGIFMKRGYKKGQIFRFIMKQSEYGTVIAGSGISGLYTALKLEQNCSGSKILLVTKSTLGESNSYYAQGGMVAVLNENNNDSVESHVKDTLVAGAGLNDGDVVRFISENSDRVVKDLLKFGVEFDRDKNGNFTLTKEAAHSVNRILHSGGDATGREIELALIKAVKENKNIEVRENTAIVDLIVEDNICRGVILFDNKDYEQINSRVVILATGGLGQIYQYTTNPQCATGDGLALAYRAGAVLRDMEFVQFHPTALAIDDSEHKNRFLISEALRGEGAKLCDKNGFEYMINYDERKELAPRDIVARANFVQMKKDNVPNVYLNATVIGKEKLLQRFKKKEKKCAQYNIDITKDYIPVSPVAHYFMGGIKTDLKGETSVKNLFAIGECASTGLHGANRLASNSLLECVVCAYKAAEYINNHYSLYHWERVEFQLEQAAKVRNSGEGCVLQKLKTKLKTTMWQNVGIFRSEESLQTALGDIDEIEQQFGKKDLCGSIEEYELRNMIIVSKLVVQSAIQRKESRGAHYRTDYLRTDENPKHSEMKI